MESTDHKKQLIYLDIGINIIKCRLELIEIP